MSSGIDALLIESDTSDAQLFEHLMQSSELTKPNVHHTARFNEAITAIEKAPFNVILLNLNLPDGKGVELIQHLLNRRPQTSIVALNNTLDTRAAVAAIQQGAQDYWVKEEILGPHRLNALGYTEVGNRLVSQLQYNIERAELTRQLRLSQQRYELAVKGANDGIWDWDIVKGQIYYSERWQSLLSLSAAEMGQSPQLWFSRIHPSDRPIFHKKLAAHLKQQTNQFECEHRLLQSDGTYRWMLCRGIALWDERGCAYRMAGSQTDISERKSLETSLYQEKELAQITLHSIGDAVITTDAKGRIKDLNPVAEKLTGWPAREAKRKSVTQVCNLVDGSTRQPLQNPSIQAIEKGHAISLSNHPLLISKNGEEFAIGDSAAPIRSSNGEIVGTVLVFHDVTEERGRAKQLAWQATHDPLTQLYNRSKFIQALDDVITDAQTTGSKHVLCCMDLDHFKAVNDTCGHEAGDRLLKQIAGLWRAQVRSSDTLARLGGDEFGLVLNDCDLDTALHIANQFCSTIQSFRFVCDENVFNIGVSIGLVPINEHNTGTQQVLKLADSACYSAKNKGRNRVQVYYPNDFDITQQSTDSQWFSRLSSALDNNQFRLYQQPIVTSDQHSDMPQLCEILLRLEDSVSHKVIPPMAFVPTAERYSLMPQIDRWVIKQFLSTLKETTIEETLCKPASSDSAAANHPQNNNIIYSINLSGASINDEGFVDFIIDQMTKYDVDTSKLCFEITETVAIANLQKAADFMLALKRLGCSFALDDFGSGMSSFGYLKNLPVDYLKIDGNFVKEAPTDDIICAMLEAINQVGHVMGLKTIAEFVETTSIMEKVRTLGIDYVQGYQISAPQPL